MALTKAKVREILSAAGIDSEHFHEAVEAIINGHLASIEALREDVAKYKEDAEKLPAVQKELDDLKGKDGNKWQTKYEDAKKELDDLKNEITAKETRAQKEKAVRAYLEGKNITGKNLDIAMRACKAETEEVELDGEKIKDTSVFDNLVTGDFAGLVVTTQVTGVHTTNPPTKNDGAVKSKEEIYKTENGKYVLSASERQAELVKLYQSQQKGD